MKYRVNEVKLGVYEDTNQIPDKIRKKLKKKNLKIDDFEIAKESVDARGKRDIKLVYTVDFSCDAKLPLGKPPAGEYENVISKEEGLKISKARRHRPVIVGMGPCGLFCALILAQMGLKPLVIERGKAVEERVKDVDRLWNEGILNPESNPRFGEGGAGTFSDGKLTTGIKDHRIRKVLTEFVRAGAPEEILYKNKPHIGTDRLRAVVINMRKELLELDADVMFETKLTDIEVEANTIKKIKVIGADGETKKIPTDTLVIAAGNGAADTVKMLHSRNVVMEQKPFSIGVRIEHPQQLIDKAQYGDAKLAERLGAAEYKLSCRVSSGRGVYTFCMCPGGRVICSSCEEGTVVTNGMSFHARDEEFANSGLLVDVRTEDFGGDDPLAGFDFRRQYETKAYRLSGGYNIPKTRWEDFAGSNVEKCLPEFAAEAIKEAMPILGKKLRGFDSPGAVMKAVETGSSCPVRIKRDENYESNIKGLYPGGEGSGYAGGITSAAVDGIKIGEAIAKQFSERK